MKDYSIIDFKSIEVEYEEGTKIDGIYNAIKLIQNNVLKVINLVLDFRYTPINGYAFLNVKFRTDEVDETLEHADYHLYAGEFEIIVKDDDTVTYDTIVPDLNNYLQFTDEAMETINENPDKTYKLVPVVIEDVGIRITVEEVTDDTTPDDTTPDNENQGGEA